MREVLSIATLLALLAFAGLEPGHAQTAKTCKVGSVAGFFSTVC